MPAMTARIATSQGSRLVNRLCKHFQHKVPATWDRTSGHVEFDIGQCLLSAGTEELILECQAPDGERLDQVGEVIASHLVRFAGGEVEAVQWQARDA